MKLHRTTLATSLRLNHPIAHTMTFLRPALCCAAIWLLAVAPVRAQTNPPPAATLQISGTGTNVNIQWNNAGTLQSAPTIDGPWTTYSGNVSVASGTATPITNSNRFFRVVNNGVAGPPVPLLPTTLTSPLQVESASIQLLPGPVPAGNTRLVLTVAPGPNSPSSSNVITLLVNNSLTLLRDDGQFPDVTANDGNFSAVINVNPSDIDSWNAELANLPANAQISYVYSGRSIIATNSLQPFPKTNFLGGQQVIIVNNIVPVGSGGGTSVSPCNGSPNAYDPRKTEMITDLSVVADPTRTWDNHGPTTPHGGGGFGTQMGPWSFGLLVSNIANTTVTGITPSDFVLRWFQSYQFNQVINGDNIPAVPAVQSSVFSQWQAATAAEGGFPPNAVDVSIAPFRLLAIANRVDLRGNSTYSGPEPAGEARFVFGVLNSSTGSTLPFTVILEYAVPLHDCAQVQNWGAQWAALNALPVPSAAFNNALQAITDQFSRAGENPAQPPNMSAIAQIRANEFLGTQWELRQFNLDASGFLVESAVNATPAITNNNTTNLEAFITNVPSPATYCIIGPLLATPSIPIPIIFNGNPFLGGWAPEAGGMIWNAPGLLGPQCCVRHIVSLNTCNACHTLETGTAFTHVTTRNFGVQSSLSGFLNGTSLGDPSGCSGVVYTYADLARRVQDLNALVTCGCVAEAAHNSLQMSH